LLSVLGALFGVQSTAVRERDFSEGQSWWVYIAIGFIAVLILVVLLVFLAKFLSSGLPA
jgi:ABC-type glycerol-3-phosphate transport system permease component